MLKHKLLLSLLWTASLLPILASCAQSDSSSESASLLALVSPDRSSPTTTEGLTLEGLLPTLLLRGCGVQSTDPQEGGSQDFSNICIAYTSTTVTIDIYFYQPVTLSWGRPFIYLYDTQDSEANELISFTSGTTYEVRRDKDNNGSFETSVYSASTITNYSGTHYKITVPRGVMPDISSRNIWAYSMASTDRIPDSGNLSFTANTSTNVLDPAEGGTDDYRKLKVGYDTTIQYVELELHSPVAGISWGRPFVYLYDPSPSSPDRYLVSYDGTSVRLLQDTDNNGSFETTVYTGATLTKLEGGNRYTLLLPAASINNISNKNMWSYTTLSTDRVPDSGNLNF